VKFEVSRLVNVQNIAFFLGAIAERRCSQVHKSTEDEMMATSLQDGKNKNSEEDYGMESYRNEI
jgi:hypothetical protein